MLKQLFDKAKTVWSKFNQKAAERLLPNKAKVDLSLLTGKKTRAWVQIGPGRKDLAHYHRRIAAAIKRDYRGMGKRKGSFFGFQWHGMGQTATFERSRRRRNSLWKRKVWETNLSNHGKRGMTVAGYRVPARNFGSY